MHFGSDDTDGGEIPDLSEFSDYEGAACNSEGEAFPYSYFQDRNANCQPRASASSPKSHINCR